MQELKLSNLSRSSSLHNGFTRPGETNSLLSSNREAMSHLGHGIESSSDPKGKLLRQLRIFHKIDPSLLASQACISLAQLYQIEQGEDSLFYSAPLRQQAARRISRLLGVEWDTLNSSMINISMRNTVHLQHVPSLEFNDTNSETYVADQLSIKGTSVFSEMNSSEPIYRIPETSRDQSLASLLSSASADVSTRTENLSQESGIFKPQKNIFSKQGHTVFWLILTAILGCIIGFIVEEWSPYQFIWPWTFIQQYI
jgi:transcriptional regulator with XRE-family HTH domain